MSNTLTLINEVPTIIKTEVSFPSYHKERFSGRMFAILNEKTAVSLYAFQGYYSVTVASPSDMTLRIEDTKPCSKEEFDAFYSKCQINISNRIQPTIA